MRAEEVTPHDDAPLTTPLTTTESRHGAESGKGQCTHSRDARSPFDSSGVRRAQSVEAAELFATFID
jgi:hypothetical protein